MRPSDGVKDVQDREIKFSKRQSTDSRYLTCNIWQSLNRATMPIKETIICPPKMPHDTTANGVKIPARIRSQNQSHDTTDNPVGWPSSPASKKVIKPVRVYSLICCTNHIARVKRTRADSQGYVLFFFSLMSPVILLGTSPEILILANFFFPRVP